MRQLEWLAQERLGSFEAQLEQVASAEFNLPGTTAALAAAKAQVDALRAELEAVSAPGEEDFFLSHVITINQKIFGLTNYLGILLRSTNLRNCLEAYFAFEGITQRFVGESNRLILSSEWDYSPFYIPEPPDALKDFVFIGFPSFVSRNAMLLPLAAHELGHAIWRKRSLDGPAATTGELILHEIIESNPEYRRDLNLRDGLFFEQDKERIVASCMSLTISHA